MLSPHRLDHRASTKRDISRWHLCVIYGLLTLCMVMGMLALVSLHHLNRRQMNVELKLGISSSSGCIYLHTHQQHVIDLGREPAPGTDYRVKGLHEVDVQEQRALISDAEPGYKDASSALGLPETSHGSSSEVARNKSSQNTDISNSVPRWEGSDDSEERNSIEYQSPKDSVQSVRPSETTNSSMRVLRRRLSREISDREGNDVETITVRPKGKTNKNREITKKRKVPQQQKLKSESDRYQGMAAIHLQAPENMERQYESGPMVSLNASYDKDIVYRFWRKASWVPASVEDVFHLDETTGHVTVEIEGIYMIYAQMVYHDLSGRWSFGIYVGHQEKVKCLATEQLRDLHAYHPTSHGVYQSCYTSIVLHIRKNQAVTIRCMYGSRTILTRPEFTFWGMVRLSS